MELHCSQTFPFLFLLLLLFETPMELHCSQTFRYIVMYIIKFETPMELHCSQTNSRHNKNS